MPELPEVETTRLGIKPYLLRRRIQQVEVREHRLRWPISRDLETVLTGQRVDAVQRRGKYLLLRIGDGTLIVHLGMSGSLRIVSRNEAPQRHDHVDLMFAKNTLRFRDPRRFGCLLWTIANPHNHPLLHRLGLEPMQPEFSGETLFILSRNRTVAVKNFIMESRVVVGVGNIYASEALFVAGIHPLRGAGRISRRRYEKLAKAIREVLQAAIDAGGTTLRDFVGAKGDAGYFSRELLVYGRAGEPCIDCGKPLRKTVIGQRSSYYCASCQH